MDPDGELLSCPTCLQEHRGEVQGPEAQAAVLRAHRTLSLGDAEAADGDAGAWGAGSVSRSIRAAPPTQQGLPTQAEGLLLWEGATGRFRGQEVASAPHSHALAVDLQDVTTTAANVAARRGNR